MRTGLIRGLLMLCISTSFAPAATITVMPDGTGDYATIQTAIDAAASGDEIVLAPGTFTGDGNRDIKPKGKNLTIRGTAPTDPGVVAGTIIDCQGSPAQPHRGFDMSGSLAAAVTISGITITRGYSSQSGGGIYVAYPGTLALANCMLAGNTAANQGGGILIYGGLSTIRDCAIADNNAAWGAGVSCQGSITISNTKFRGNVATTNGGGLLIMALCTVSGCIFEANSAPQASGLSCSSMPGTSATVVNSIFVRNTVLNDPNDAPLGGAAMVPSDAAATFSHCTFLDNGRQGSTLYCRSGTASLSHCIVWSRQYAPIDSTTLTATWCDIAGGYSGQGNINVDPQLTPAGRLPVGSPCINAGNPAFGATPSTDINGLPRVSAGRVDIGADEWLDGDADALPDGWEIKYFGTATAADPSQDARGDGLANRLKFPLSIAPVAQGRLYVAAAGGSDASDGRAAAWDGTHGPKATIQAAVDAAWYDETIILQPGTYTGPGNRDIDLRGKSLTVRGTDVYNAAVVAGTVIDCGDLAGGHRGFNLSSGRGATAIISGLTITNGSAGDGGGISTTLPPLVVARCVLTGNTAANTGGAISCRGARLLVCDSTIRRNRATYGAAGIYSGPSVHDGLVTPLTSYSLLGRDVTLLNCTIRENTATGLPYDQEGQGGGAILSGSVRIDGCVIEDNYALQGGGLLCGAWYGAVITNTRICRNQSLVKGGGILCADGPTILDNCLMAHNTSLYSGYSPVKQGGGGLFISNGAVTLRNCTLACNASPAVVGTFVGNVSLANSILWGYGTSEFDLPVQPTATYSNIAGGLPGDGNISIDPQLTWDGHLQAGSPCINAGDPTYTNPAELTDIDGEPRALTNRIDIGADEFFDADTDALPDAWESRYFASATTADPAADDSDTGRTNLQKYILSLDPIRPPTNYYVTPAGRDASDGLAASSDGTHGPKATIQAAIDAAAFDTLDRVIIAPGTYTGPGNRNLTFRGKTITVQGTDPDAPATVASTIIDCQATAASPARGFIFNNTERPLCTLAGLTITAGYVTSSNSGAAILCQRNSSPTIRDCRLIANTSMGGGYPASGGALAAIDADPTVLRCRIQGNIAGGGVYCSSSRASFQQCVIDQNTTGLQGGAGIRIASGQVSLTGCTISGNSATGSYGGGVCLQAAARAILRNCLIAAHANPYNGAGIYCTEGSTLILLNSTVTANQSGTHTQTGGIHFDYTCTGQIANSIVWGNTTAGNLDSEQIKKLGGSAGLSVSYSITRGYNYTSVNNQNIDPKLTAAYRLQPTSPVINAGDPAYSPIPGETDIDGQPRVVRGRLDIGADELALTGDINGDGPIDVVDLLILAGTWGTARSDAGYDPLCDLSADGRIDIIDLLTLADNWGLSL